MYFTDTLLLLNLEFGCNRIIFFFDICFLFFIYHGPWPHLGIVDQKVWHDVWVDAETEPKSVLPKTWLHSSMPCILKSHSSPPV